MSRIDDSGADGDIIEVLDEDGPFFLQFIDDVSVMDDFMLHINGGAPNFQRPFHRVDCSLDTCAETSWLRKKQSHSKIGLRGAACIRKFAVR